MICLFLRINLPLWYRTWKHCSRLPLRLQQPFHPLHRLPDHQNWILTKKRNWYLLRSLESPTWCRRRPWDPGPPSGLGLDTRDFRWRTRRHWGRTRAPTSSCIGPPSPYPPHPSLFTNSPHWLPSAYSSLAWGQRNQRPVTLLHLLTQPHSLQTVQIQLSW